MGTLKKDRTLLLRDERKMEKLKAKLHTDDDCECELAKASRSVVDILMALRPFLIFTIMNLTQGHHLDVCFITQVKFFAWTYQSLMTLPLLSFPQRTPIKF